MFFTFSHRLSILLQNCRMRESVKENFLLLSMFSVLFYEMLFFGKGYKEEHTLTIFPLCSLNTLSPSTPTNLLHKYLFGLDIFCKIMTSFLKKSIPYSIFFYHLTLKPYAVGMQKNHVTDTIMLTLFYIQQTAAHNFEYMSSKTQKIFVLSNFYFDSVFKNRLLQRRLKASLWGKGLSTLNIGFSWVTRKLDRYCRVKTCWLPLI